MRALLLKLLYAVCAVTLYPLAASAGGACATCGNDPNFPDAEAFLTAHNYPNSDYRVLFSWSERLPDGSGKFVTGYRVKPLHGGEPFDLYSDGAENLLGQEQIAVAGITPKNWNLPPVETTGFVPEALSKSLPARPKPVGPSGGLTPVESVILPYIDHQKALQEDADRQVSGVKASQRIAVFQNLDRTIKVNGEIVSAGAWRPAPHDGRLWSVSIIAPEALGIRVHFTSLSIPQGAQLVIYNENDPAEALGPYSEPAKSQPDLWSATCFSDSVVIECFVPKDVALSGVRFTIDKITHQYVGLAGLQWAKAVWTKSAGSCNNDVSCYTAWVTASKGIAGYDGIDSGGGFFCSGALLADTSNTATPYFLTANHCVSLSSTASTLEFFWFYQTSSCNGAPPSINSVPATTGGAALLATSDVTSGTDFCLLRLNTAPPAGVSFLGWSTTATAMGTSTACIHHPSGDYKRISFGALTNVNPSEPANRFHQNTWSSGVTEPGSSGSPLMIAATGQVLGQLYGGPSYCGAPSYALMDYYGRFDQTYPIVQSYLNPVGALRVTITPPAAVSAGAQWRVDGGPWQNSGVTVGSLSVGQHTITFSAVAGWTAPSNQTATIARGALTTAAGVYVVIPPTGSLQVTLGPAAAVTAGAQWRVDNGLWRNSGATVNGLSTGQHTVDFKPISGWTTPANLPVTVNDGLTANAGGTYIIIIPSGSAQVTILPADAANVGGQWRVDGGAWKGSGATVSSLSVGQHTIDFKPVAGWSAPSSKVITVNDGQTTPVTGEYILVSPAGSLHVTMGPSAALTAGARWRVDSGSWQNSGATVNGLAVGQHTLEFAPVTAWVTPPNQTAQIADSQTTGAAGVYTLFADVSGDGTVNATDIQLVIDTALVALPFSPSADINSDSAVNAVDIQLAINAALGIF